MKTKTEMHEGPKAFKRFKNLMKTVLQVPHSEIQKRVEAERGKALQNPNRPGPRPKRRRRSRASAVASKRD